MNAVPIAAQPILLGMPDANQGQAWVACYFDFRANRGAELNETGQTPDEAVARLWLALHRNGRQ